jgi:hypothetical protein
MECEIYDRLEGDLIRIREITTQLAMNGGLTGEKAQQLAQMEREAVDRLTDHRAEHGCKRPGE